MYTPVEVNHARAAMVRRASASAAGNGGGFFIFGVLITFLLVFTTQCTMVEAKRGCANFGHSCYGGMGKRAGLNEEYASQESNQIADVDPGLVFTGPRSMPPHVYSQRPYMNNKMAVDDKMAPYFKQLLRLYRTMQREEQNQLDTAIEK